MKTRVVPFALILSVGVAVSAFARDEAPKPATSAAAKTAAEVQIGSLTVGDKAPALAINKWVKGSPVTSFEPGKVTVVEFWATWCGPCKASMPHLTELQKKYRDQGVTIIGVTSVDPRNTLAGVEKMTAEKADVMGYTIAWDQERQTTTAYMMAAAQPGIPTAFIVDQTGTIAWIGSPFEMDEPLAKIVAGKWDVAAARSEFQPKQQETIGMMQFSMASRAKNVQAMLENGQKLLDSRAKDPNIMNMVAWSIVDPDRGIDLKANPKLAALALAAANKANEATGGKEPGMLDTLAWAQFANGDTAGAIATEQKAIGLAKDAELKKELEASLARFQK
ncbi:MAG: TlpA family protein disulfide reductase [Phycisphaerae bacterium]|nr:TlpA family protein disulfide reductase [Phycisphaerae bacterium]